MREAVVRTVGEMLQVVAPVLRDILTVEELAATTLTAVHWTPDRTPVAPVDEWPRLDDDAALDEDTMLSVRTYEDAYGSWMQGRETAPEMIERVRSELQDFAAESTFGWGQLRP